MKKLNYTEGKWSLPHFVTNKDNPEACQCVFVLSEGYCGSIADISIDNGKKISDGGNDSPPLEEAIGNAKLICAAPEMYELLIKMTHQLKIMKHECKSKGYNSTIDKAESLLKKLHE